MIILNVMLTNPMLPLSSRKTGFSLLELLVAMTIFAVIFLSIWSLVGNLQFAQNKIVVANNFYDESRLLMERVVQMVRNNTIDYDRYYCGDESGCAGAYESTFYTDVGDRERNTGLGVAAFTGNQSVLYLINAERTVRTAIKVETVDLVEGLLQVQTQIGIDTDGDGKIDRWSDSPDSHCQISGFAVVLGSETDQDLFCTRAHEWTTIAPDQLQISSLTFTITPDKDPYLAFRDNDAQIQPLVRIGMTTQMRNPSRFGFPESQTPTVYLQTAASSRVFGNTR